MEWKKVEDGLPEYWVRVLVTDGETMAVGSRVLSRREYWRQEDETTKKLVCEEDWYWVVDAEGCGGYPTHWMELPELPPKPPEDPEKKRERLLLGLEEKLEHEDYLAENPQK